MFDPVQLEETARKILETSSQKLTMQDGIRIAKRELHRDLVIKVIDGWVAGATRGVYIADVSRYMWENNIRNYDRYETLESKGFSLSKVLLPCGGYVVILWCKYDDGVTETYHIVER